MGEPAPAANSCGTTAVLLCGLLAVAGLACHRDERTGGGETTKEIVERPFGLEIVDARPAVTDLAKAAPSEFRRLFTDTYSLLPDRRFLHAAAAIERLVTGAKTVRLRLEVRDGRWAVSSGTRRVGTFTAELAYPEMIAVLASWSRDLLREVPPVPCREIDSNQLAPIQKALDSFYPPGPFVALEGLDRLWQPRRADCGLLDLAARSLLLLELEGLDSLEVADGLAGRTLAAQTLAQVTGAPRRPSDEALLAYLLGYGADAAKMASTLPATDPTRLYVTGETAALVRVAAGPGTGERTRYLALRSLASGRQGATHRSWATSKERAEWDGFARTLFGGRVSELPILRAGLEINAFETNPRFAEAILYSAVSEVSNHLRPAGATRPPVADPAGSETAAGDWFTALLQRFIASSRARPGSHAPGVVRAFETVLVQETAGKKGPFWDSDAVRSYYSGLFYSGLFSLGEHFRTALSAVEATRGFAEYLKDAPPGRGAQFSQWYADLASVKSGQPVTERHLRDLSALDALGAPAAHRLFEVLGDYWPDNNDSAPAVSASLVRRLDSRPWQRAEWTLVAFDPLMDLRLAESLCRQWLLLEPNDDPRPKIRCLRATRDTKTLQAVADDRRYGTGTRVFALWALSRFQKSRLECRSRYRSLAAETGYSSDVVVPYIDYLDYQGDFAESERVVREWLARHSDSEGLEHDIYLGRLAHLRLLRGHADEAWKIIEPVVSSFQAGVLIWAMEILAANDRRGEALKIGRQLVERYPDEVSSRAAFAEQLWREKRYSEAALVLDPPEAGYKPVGAWSGLVARHFGFAFREKSDAEVLAAIDALRAQGIEDVQLEYLIPTFADESRFDLAFQMHTRLAALLRRHTWDISRGRLHAAQYLEKAKGRPAALTWLRANVLPVHREAFAEVCYDERAFDYLWDAFPPDAVLTEWSWLVRAASVAANPGPGPRREALLAHYSGSATNDSRGSLARSILGLGEETAPAAPAQGADVRCETAYFRSARAIGEGRYEDASDLLHVVRATCNHSWRVARFSRTTLNKWSYDYGTLAEAAAAKKW